VDDQISPIAYPDRAAWLAGLYFPQVPILPKLDFRVEGTFTDNPLGGAICCGFFYNAGPRYPNGYTNDRNLLASWIGREGQGAQAWATYWLSPRNKVQLTYRHQKVSQEFIPFGGTLYDAGLHADIALRRNVTVSGYVQYEKWNFPIVASQPQTNWTSSLSLSFWPRGWSK
jgi:hypothetical protein